VHANSGGAYGVVERSLPDHAVTTVKILQKFIRPALGRQGV
jgi:hypothetical protein